MKLMDLAESYCPWLVPLAFFTFPAQRNSFWGALPPMVSWSFLLASSSLPDIDGSASAAIWANCWVSDNSSDLPTSAKFSASSTLLSTSLSVGAGSTSDTGESASTGGSCSECTSALVLTWRALFPSHILSVFLVLTILNLKESQPIRSQSILMRVIWHLLWILISVTFSLQPISLHSVYLWERKKS